MAFESSNLLALQIEAQHFLDCIKQGATPLTDGRQGLELVRILEASSESLKQGGAPVEFVKEMNVKGWQTPPVFPEAAPRASAAEVSAPKLRAGKRTHLNGRKHEEKTDTNGSKS